RDGLELVEGERPRLALHVREVPAFVALPLDADPRVPRPARAAAAQQRPCPEAVPPEVEDAGGDGAVGLPVDPPAGRLPGEAPERPRPRRPELRLRARLARALAHVVRPRVGRGVEDGGG